MKNHTLGTFSSGATAGTATAAYSIQLNETDNNNRNNIGVFNVAGAATAGVITVQGSCTGGSSNWEWVDLATGLTPVAGSTTVGGSAAKTVALMPFMRAVVTTAIATNAVTCYISQ
jgi:hypothetical protein